MDTPTRRKRQRSASPTESERTYWQDRLTRMKAELEIEDQRWSTLTTEQKLLEDGQILTGRLEQEPAMLMLLQPSPPKHMIQSACCARGCPNSQLSEEGCYIMDDYRILVIDNRGNEHYHVSCLEKMISLPALAPSRFMLDGQGRRWNNGWPWTWSLMLRKWFAYGGRIDLVKVADYIEAYSSGYDKSTGRADNKLITHLEGCDGDLCACPSDPKDPEELEDSEPETLILQDYHTEEACSLLELLEHPLSEELCTQLNVRGFGFSYTIVPETELAEIGEEQADPNAPLAS